jgi:hypothetical protein
MKAVRRFTQQQVIDALVQGEGFKITAAAALRCSRRTITRYIERYPAVREAYEDARQATLDLAESRLLALVRKDDWRAIRYLLSTLGKDRGYTERQEIVAVGDNTESLRQQILEDITRIYGDDDEEKDDEN